MAVTHSFPKLANRISWHPWALEARPWIISQGEGFHCRYKCEYLTSYQLSPFPFHLSMSLPDFLSLLLSNPLLIWNSRTVFGCVCQRFVPFVLILLTFDVLVPNFNIQWKLNFDKDDNWGKKTKESHQLEQWLHNPRDWERFFLIIIINYEIESFKFKTPKVGRGSFNML